MQQINLISRSHVIKCNELLPVEFTVGDYHTTQPIYICHKIDRIYPQKAAYIDAHILHKSFPQPVNHPVAAIQSNEPTSKTTNPVKRTPPSTKPSKIRFAPTNENIPKLKHYLLEKFSSSPFSQWLPTSTSTSATPSHAILQTFTNTCSTSLEKKYQRKPRSRHGMRNHQTC